MRRRVALYGATEEALALVPALDGNPALELVAIYDPDADAARARVAAILSAEDLERVTADRHVLEEPLHAVIDAGSLPPFGEAFPDANARGTQIVSPHTARLLWAYSGHARDDQAELLQALREVVESVNLTIDPDELFARMLEIAMGVTGADGGSLMLLDEAARELRIRVALGVEPELWKKIRVPLGEGIAGRVAADARPLKVRGRADRTRFRIVRDRFDVESALCVPLVHEGRVLGVLNLHHTERADAFDDDDLAFAEELGSLDAQIIARAQEHEALRSQAARYAAVRAVREALAGPAPLIERLTALCRVVAGRLGGGVATVLLLDADEQGLRLGATSLEGASLGGEYRLALDQGVDGRAAKRREPVFLNAPNGSLGYAALPLVAGHKLVGVLSVQGGAEEEATLGHGRALEECLLEITASVAEEVAQSEREARMATRATRAGAINEAGIRLVSARDPAEVARLATSSGALILDADHAVLRLQDPDTRRYVIRSYYGAADGRTQERLFRLDKRLSVDVIKARGPIHVRHVKDEPTYAALDSGLRSALIAPLTREGQIVGTLALYDRVAPDQFYPTSFGDDDLQVFVRYVSYVERALDGAISWERASVNRNFDEETGLPNESYLQRRLEQEIARAADGGAGPALVTCSLDNMGEIRRSADPMLGDRLLQRCAETLRASLRDFDVLARTADATFTALLPDPGADAEGRITAIARRVADEISKDDRLQRPTRPSLAFGYALYDRDGSDADALRRAAERARIRML